VFTFLCQIPAKSGYPVNRTQVYYGGYNSWVVRHCERSEAIKAFYVLNTCRAGIASSLRSSQWRREMHFCYCHRGFGYPWTV